MNTSNKGTSFLKEFKDFITFLQNLWSILAGISVLFPLSNALTKVIPLRYISDDPPGALEYLSPGLITSVATLITLFVILWTFGQRHKFKTRRERHLIRRGARLSFAIGLLALTLYFVVYFGIYNLYYAAWEIWSGDPRRLFGDVVLLFFYSTFFASITKAFMLLGMIEFFGRES